MTLHWDYALSFLVSFTFESRRSNKELINLLNIVLIKVLRNWFSWIKFVIPNRATVCRAQLTHFFKSDENFALQSFAQQDNHNFSKWLFTLLGSLVLQLKTLLLVLGKIFRRAQVKNFLFGDENYARWIVSPDDDSSIRYYDIVSKHITELFFK